ncbi:TPA: hypothetical protein ACLGO4_004593 [Salmonella enterica]
MLHEMTKNTGQFLVSLKEHPASLICITLLVAFLVFRCYKDPDFIIWVLLGIFLIPALYMIVYNLGEASNIEKQEKAAQEQWFSQHCQIVEKREGSTSLEGGLGVSMKGNVASGIFTNSIPDQTAYKCDDGITYWRNK